MIELPLVATNREDQGKTVGGAINHMLRLMREELVAESSVSIATAYINPAGYALLADELNDTSRVRLLIGAEPEFEADQAKSRGDNSAQNAIVDALKSHEAWLAAERDLSGFTREAFASAKAMVEWLESNVDGTPRVEVRRYKHGFLHGKSFLVQAGHAAAAISGSSNFTYAGLAKNAELNLATSGSPGHVKDIAEWFEHYWNESEAYDLASLYKTQWSPHEPWPVFVRMLHELYGAGTKEEETPSGRLGLTNFQKDGVTRMRRLLNENGGVLVADEVGLGKSYLAGEMIRTATEENRQRAVIICPAAIRTSMWEPFLEKHNFQRNVKVYSYEKVRNGLKRPAALPENASRAEKDKYEADVNKVKKFEQKMNDFALVVIDEAHNLRNANTSRAEALDQVLLSGAHPKQIILLTATPVNNSLSDLETLVKYFIRDDARFANVGIPSIRSYIKRAQDTDPENLTPEHLFDLMDQVAVRRTRKFVRDNYANDKIIGRDGIETTIKFPTPKSHRIDYKLTDSGLKLVDAMLYALSVDDESADNNSYRIRRGDPKHLMLARYTPSAYLKAGDLERHQVTNAGLLRSALLKRLESSPKALYNTLKKIGAAHDAFLMGCDEGYVIVGSALSDLTNTDDDDFVEILQGFDISSRKDIRPLAEYKGKDLIEDVKSDRALLTELTELAREAFQGEDPKYEKLVESLMQIANDAKKIDQNGVSEGDRRKVIVFSTFADTIMDLHERLSFELDTSRNTQLDPYKDRLAPPIMGSYASTKRAGDSGGVDMGGRASTIAGFAPKTAGDYVAGIYIDEDQYDILLTTDVLAEGVNLQQAAHIINYDLPWNPMRIVQRHGRIDRIGSEHDYVHLSLFFPGEKLDEMLKLEETLQRKLAQANAATGEHIEVLAKSRVQTEVILHDKSMQAMDNFLESRGGENAASGEEYRRRLYKYLVENPESNAAVELPYGAGSGFVNPRIPVSGYVFCAKVGKHEKPWFRFIQVDDDWNVAKRPANPELNIEESVLMSGESLVSLTAADSLTPGQERDLPEQAYSKAFDAWAVAQADILEKWNYLADPANVGPQPPKSFRTAYALVMEHGDFLEGEIMRGMLGRLKAVPARRVELEVNRALNMVGSKKQIISEIQEILDAAGIQAPPPVATLPSVNEHEVRLVVWMAVQGTGGKVAAVQVD